MKSTTKVALWCAVLASLALVVFSLALAFAHERGQNKRADARLRTASGRFFAEFEKQGGKVEWIKRDAIERAIAPTGGGSEFYEITDGSGRVLLRSEGLSSQSLAGAPAGAGWGTVDGKRMRTYSHSAGGLTVRIGAQLLDEEEENRQLVRMMMLSLPVVLVGIGTAAWFVARRALKPVRDMAHAVEGISAEKPGRRLPGNERADEIGRLSRAFNSTLDRLETSFQQAVRFSADASHELKTPIAVIRAGLGELMHSRNLAVEDQEVVAELMEQCARVAAITDCLLLLARVDAGRLTVSTKPVDAAALVADLAEDFEFTDSSGAVKIERVAAPDAWVLADPQMMRQVLANLLDNAMKYNVPGGKVRIEVKASERDVAIRVGNSGVEIPREHQARIFERFYRIEHTSEVRGTGLGLCLGCELARAMGGRLELAGSNDGWTEFELTLPRAPRSGKAGSENR